MDRIEDLKSGYRGAYISLAYVDGDKQAIEDVQILPPALTLIEALLAGKWECETCIYFDQHAAAFGETRCGLRNIDPMWSGECVPCGEWDRYRVKP